MTMVLQTTETSVHENVACNTQSHSPVGQVELFDDMGFLRLPTLLSPATSSKLRDYILQDLRSTLEMDKEESEARFSNIRERKHRWDLKLGESAIVRDALGQVLSNNNFLHSVLAPLCQCTKNEIEHVVLAELGSLVSEPGAKHQEWHADTAHTGPTEPDCICCFITLQETPTSMGPTQLIPHTHLGDFHTMAISNFPPKGLMPTSLEPKSMENGFSSAGDALLMDCRLYHRGSANTYQVEEGSDPDQGKRVVFYFTVRSRQMPRPGGLLFTILKELDERPLVDFLCDKRGI